MIFMIFHRDHHAMIFLLFIFSPVLLKNITPPVRSAHFSLSLSLSLSLCVWGGGIPLFLSLSLFVYVYVCEWLFYFDKFLDEFHLGRSTTGGSGCEAGGFFLLMIINFILAF
jgi:hypothetical protein